MSQASPDASLADRCRMNHLATAVVGLSQGIPFFHAGDEILRSKVRVCASSTLLREPSFIKGLDESPLACVLGLAQKGLTYLRLG